MSESELLATLTDEEGERLIKIMAAREAAMLMLTQAHSLLANAKSDEGIFYSEIRAKYNIQDGIIHSILRDKVRIYKGYWCDKND